MTLNVGFDFDEPIYPWYDLAHKASVKAGIATPDMEPTEWAPYELYGCTAQEWYDILDEEIRHGDMYTQPIPQDKVDLLRYLDDLGVRIHIITARGNFGPLGERIKEITRDCIDQVGLPHDSLHFVKDKVPTALNLGLDYMLDDHPKNHDPLTAAGVNSFLLDERWNQDHPEKWYPEGNRVRSTEEYVSIILRENSLS